MDDILVDVRARPATFATRGEAAWREAVAEAVGTREVPDGGRFEVELEFRLPLPTRANEAWDLDNLVKPTLDALGGVIGFRRWNGRPQADDETDRSHRRRQAHGGTWRDAWRDDPHHDGTPLNSPVVSHRACIRLRTIVRMTERITVSFDEAVARRVRQRGEQTRGGASGYLERLVRQDELREALQAHGRWFAANPGYETDAQDEAAARDA
ncbi:hypothetical protein [Actinomycetospora aeridis]|uniref:Uncharacterized protein n=1 Tax=Actinomycetospora aeridis TaxID=3129231 RepID=A0ABU8NBH0_9PSEU